MNVTDKYGCNECGTTYVGETSRNLYTRAREHQHKFKKNKTHCTDKLERQSRSQTVKEKY